jgi:hypothetical protein
VETYCYPRSQNTVDIRQKDPAFVDDQALHGVLKTTGGSATVPGAEAGGVEDLNADALYSRKMRKECLAELHSKHEVQYSELLAES